jgi:hypothetical protein
MSFIERARSVKNRLNKVHAIGSENYIRFYPNPGVGLARGTKRIAASVHGGIELFVQTNRSELPWKRIWSFATRVQRPV